MAKYMISHICGHDEEARIVGPEKDRPSKHEWYATQLCTECRHNAASLAVEEWTAVHNLLVLSGTEKQITWANRIRKDLLSDMERYTERANELPEAPDAEYVLRAYRWAMKQSKSVWWIDRRGHTGKTLMKSMIEHLKMNDAKKAEAVVNG